MTEDSKKSTDPRDNLIPFEKGSERARAMGRKSAEARKQKKADMYALLTEAGYPDPDDAPPALLKLAEKAASSNANASDMRLFLQQANLLKKGEHEWDGDGPCPTCGLDPTEGLMLSGQDLDELEKNLERMKRLVEETERVQEELRRQREPGEGA